ncbi:MAG TPA: hypothetical protein VMI94_04130 [Bryobacteraceae bacterium]|nr:hypothetical protein [Bryobacteraceae bacterium]
MSSPQTTQPNQPQYQISALNLFPVYATRAAYQQATGLQAPPFDATQPVKGWADPAPSGQPYLVFDPGATATGYLSQLTVPAAQASRLNLPGTYNYPAYVPASTGAIEVGPFGPVGPASPDMICLQSDAQAVATAIAPLFPGQTLKVFETMKQGQAMYYYSYPANELRRAWAFQVTMGGSPVILFAQQLIDGQNAHGVGAPGHWTLSSTLNWVYDAPVTAAPANAVTLPVPIRPLMPNEQIVHLAGTLFNPQGTWVVERTDLPQTSTAGSGTDNSSQLADLQAAVSAMQATLAAIEAKLGIQ